MTRTAPTARAVDAEARRRLDIDRLLDEQRDAIRAAAAGRDVLVVMPTGSGKSAIYQLAGEMRPGPTIVVSPLLALQHDQMTSIEETALSTARALNSLQPAAELDAIVDRLGLEDHMAVAGGFDRPEIDLRVDTFHDAGAKRDALVSAVSHRDGAGIVYVATRRAAAEVAQALRDVGTSADHYHRSLARRERERVHEQFLSGELRVVAATNAFGMGIDKPDVRFVLHLDVPASLDAYYQEIGRAGRRRARAGGCAGARPARARTHRPRDRPGSALAAAKEAEAARERVERSRIEMMRAYAESATCRRLVLLGYYGEAFEPPCGRCDNCRAGLVASAPADAPFAAGQAVEHREWGIGRVMIVEPERLVVLFDAHGYRTLALPLVVEAGIVTAAPAGAHR